MTKTVLEVKNLTKKYGDLVAVNSISFSVAKGEVFGILGPNGAGKTTTLEMIETLREIDGGTATIAPSLGSIPIFIGLSGSCIPFFTYLTR